LRIHSRLCLLLLFILLLTLLLRPIPSSAAASEYIEELRIRVVFYPNGTANISQNITLVRFNPSNSDMFELNLFSLARSDRYAPIVPFVLAQRTLNVRDLLLSVTPGGESLSATSAPSSYELPLRSTASRVLISATYVVDGSRWDYSIITEYSLAAVLPQVEIRRIDVEMTLVDSKVPFAGTPLATAFFDGKMGVNTIGGGIGFLGVPAISRSSTNSGNTVWLVLDQPFVGQLTFDMRYQVAPIPDLAWHDATSGLFMDLSYLVLASVFVLLSLLLIFTSSSIPIGRRRTLVSDVFNSFNPRLVGVYFVAILVVNVIFNSWSVLPNYLQTYFWGTLFPTQIFFIFWNIVMFLWPVLAVFNYSLRHQLRGTKEDLERTVTHRRLVLWVKHEPILVFLLFVHAVTTCLFITTLTSTLANNVTEPWNTWHKGATSVVITALAYVCSAYLLTRPFGNLLLREERVHTFVRGSLIACRRTHAMPDLGFTEYVKIDSQLAPTKDEIISNMMERFSDNASNQMNNSLQEAFALVQAFAYLVALGYVGLSKDESTKDRVISAKLYGDFQIRTETSLEPILLLHEKIPDYPTEAYTRLSQLINRHSQPRLRGDNLS